MPLLKIAEYFSKLGEWLIIEFVPKGDPMVGELLALREDVFPDFTEECFAQYLTAKAEIVATSPPTKSGRKLFRFRRR